VPLVLARPAHGLADQRPGDAAAAPVRVDPLQAPGVGLGNHGGHADRDPVGAGNEVGRGWPALGPLAPDVVGEGRLSSQGAGEGLGCVGQRPQPQLA
jgi:hypothetical protein